MKNAVLVCVLAGLLEAQAPVVELDMTSRMVFDEWFKKEYHIGRLGAKTVAFNIRALVAQDSEPYTLKGSYVWDGRVGRLVWEQPLKAKPIERAGLGVATFNMWMSPEGVKHLFHGCKLTTTRDTSTSPPGFMITAQGPSKGNVRTLRFNPEGVLIGMGREISLLRDKVPVTIRFMYESADDRWLLKEVRSEAVYGSRKSRTTTRFWHKKIDGLHVIVRLEQVTKGAVDGRPGRFILDLTEYRINGAKKSATPK